jgi:hypothetical protein
MAQTWTVWRRMRKITADTAEADFRRIARQIGGRILFPTRKVGDDGKVLPPTRQADGHTVNQARGFGNAEIEDRFDLTLECIRLHYCDVNDLEINPLGPTLARYADFFKLFKDFRRYTKFFLLEDWVSEDASVVKLLMRFDGFGSGRPLPKDRDEYLEYRDNLISLVRARNRRMDDYIRIAEG